MVKRSFLLCWIVAGLLCTTPVYAQQAAETAAAVDTLAPYPKKMPERTTWEQIVSFPGTLIYFPLKLTFAGIRHSVAWFQDSPGLEPLRQLLAPKIRIRGVLPTASSRSGIGLKFYFNDITGLGSKFTISSKHGVVDRRQKHYIRLQDIALGGSMVGKAQIEYRYLLTESWFGAGADSRYDDRSTFALERTSAEFSIASKFGDRSRGGIRFGYEQNGIFEGLLDDAPSLTAVASDSLPGLGTGLRFISAAAYFSADTRNNLALTTAGWVGEFGAAIYSQTDGSDFRFWRLSLDVTRYLHLFYDRRLLVRVAAERTQPIGDREVPFFMLSELGRRESIRGFNRGRFRDRDMLLVSLEYRYPIWQFFDWVWFMDAGQVSSDIFRQFDLDDFAVGAGGGLRIHSSRGQVLQFLIGASSDRVRIYLVLN